MAHADELAEIARHALWRRRDDEQDGCGSDRQQIPDPDLSPPAKSCLACRCSTPCRTARCEIVPHRVVLLFRQGPDLHLRQRRCRSASEHAASTRPGTCSEADAKLLNEFYKSYNVISLLAGNTGCQMGGWFRKEIKDVPISRPEIPHAAASPVACCRSSASCRSSSPAATSIRRWRRAPSTRPSGSVPTTTRSSASTRSAPHYYYPGWWEGGPMLLAFVNLDKWNALPKYYQERAGAGRPHRQQLHDGAL